MKKAAAAQGRRQPYRVVVVGDTCVSEEGIAAIVAWDERYEVCGGAHGFVDAGQLIRKYRPDILLIEPSLERRHGILWIKDLVHEYPQTRILIVSRQSVRIYAERALQAGAAGYWMKNGSAEELLHALETVVGGEIYISPRIASSTVHKFHRGDLPDGVDGIANSRCSH
jgi:DNA-binding NarL/FixJ family response regulator